MKKIMFNDKFGLTQAVLDGRKTMTRREIKCPHTFNGIEVSGFRIAHNANGDWYTYLVDDDEREIDGSYLKPTYEVGEVVAIAQSYNNIIQETFDKKGEFKGECSILRSKGLNNKMFVKAELMPHHIRITNIRVERLQDISDEDCLREGVEKLEYDYVVRGIGHCNHAKDMFEWLIDKVSGKGTWEQNPYVFVYEFEKVD